MAIKTALLYYGLFQIIDTSLISFDYIGLETMFLIAFPRLIQFPQVIFFKRNNHRVLFDYKDMHSFKTPQKS